MNGRLRHGAALATLIGAALLAPLGWAGPPEDVNASIDKFLAARSFHADITVTGPKPVNRQLEFVAPGRYRMRTAGVGDQVVIGDVMFLNLAGQTTSVPMPEATLAEWRDPARLAENADDMIVIALGDESVGGKPAKRYRVDHTQPQAGTLTLWVGLDGYPLQIVSSVYAQGEEITTTIRYSRFNDPTIRIDPPT